MYELLPKLDKQELVDDLQLATLMVALVVPGSNADLALLDKDVLLATIRRINEPDPEKLG